jgi:hypothetical protein
MVRDIWFLVSAALIVLMIAITAFLTAPQLP